MYILGLFSEYIKVMKTDNSFILLLLIRNCLLYKTKLYYTCLDFSFKTIPLRISLPKNINLILHCNLQGSDVQVVDLECMQFFVAVEMNLVLINKPKFC